MQTKGFRTFFK